MSRYLGKYSVELRERKLPEIVNLVIFALKELREIYKNEYEGEGECEKHVCLYFLRRIVAVCCRPDALSSQARGICKNGWWSVEGSFVAGVGT